MSDSSGIDRDSAAGGGLLHNMSAPPRLKITLNPIPASPRSPAGGDVVPCGLRLLARVNLDPFRAEVDRNYAGVREYTAWELARVVLIGKLVLGQPHRGIIALRRRSHEYLEDEILRNLAAIDISAMDLPAFAIVCKGAADDRCDVACETDPARALSLIARVSGSVFVGRREPRSAPFRERVAEYRFYAADQASGGKEQA